MKRKNMDTETAWAAGLFDGEGSAFVNQNRVKVSVSQSGAGLPQVLTRFKDVVEVGSISGPYVRKGSTAKPRWEFRATGYDARLVIETIWPYLGDVKREQAAKALAGSTPTDRRGMKTRAPLTHCKRQHEIAIVGRYARGQCKACAAEDRAKQT